MYTLIHYRPDGSDYCRGCLMGTSPSELEIEVHDNVDTAALSIAQKELENTTSGREYAAWETTILVDGYPEVDHPEWGNQNNSDPGKPYTELEEAVREKIRELKEEQNRVKIAQDAVKSQIVFEKVLENW